MPQTCRQFSVATGQFHPVGCCLIQVVTLPHGIPPLHALCCLLAVPNDVPQRVGIQSLGMCLPPCEVFGSGKFLSAKHGSVAVGLAHCRAWVGHPQVPFVPVIKVSQGTLTVQGAVCYLKTSSSGVDSQVESAKTDP